MDFTVKLARTTGGRLNEYVTTTLLQLSENNNQGRGRIFQLNKIKRGVGARQTEGGRVGDRFYGDHWGLSV